MVLLVSAIWSPTAGEPQKLDWCGLTFDMSGDRRQAKPAGGRPLDGGVRRHLPQHGQPVGAGPKVIVVEL